MLVGFVVLDEGTWSRRDIAKPKLDFGFATLLGHRGSDVPPARHSLPLSSSPNDQYKRHPLGVPFVLVRQSIL